MNMDHEFFKAQFVPVSSVDPSLFRRPLPADYQTCKSINGSETGSSDADSNGFEKLAAIESDVIVIDKVPEQAEKPIESAPTRRKRNLESSPAPVASPLTTSSTPSFHRTAIMKHLVKPQVSGSSKRPLNDNGKGPARSKFAKYSHPEIDAPVYANTKKLPQPGLLTRTSYGGGGSSSSFFPGYVPSKDFSDRKSDVSSDASDRPRRTAALSTSIKRTLKNSIMNAMKPNPSPKNYDSIQTSVHTDFSQSSCSNFDLTDPFSSYEMISGQLDKNYQTPPISSNNSSVCLLEPGLISSSLIDNDDGFFSFSSNSLEPASQNECDMGLFNVYNGDYQSL
jgi:hypothetical protein